MIRRIFLFFAIILILILISGVLPGCASKDLSADVVKALAQGLGDMAKLTMTGLQSQVQGIDNELTVIETKLLKLEQVAEPALQWVELTKAQVTGEGLGGQWVIQVVADLYKLKNDQYGVVKLQLNAELISAGMKYESIIQIEDATTGTVTTYEQLRGDLQRKIAALMLQRDIRVKAFNLVKETAVDAVNQAPNWKVKMVNAATYEIVGQGLGWDNSLTRGQWLYYTDAAKLAPSDNAAIALEKFLKGQ